MYNNNNNNINNFCNNCGMKGHLFHQCKLPITSIGLIVFHKDKKESGKKSENIKYLMIRRKDSLGYVDFMRGKYNLNNIMHLLNIINEMTQEEKNNILNIDFNTLWNNLWGDYINNQYKNEKQNAFEKIKYLKSGIIIDNKYYNLKSLINESTTNWIEPEWGFPKGRRNYMETGIKCALREFQEETGISKDNIKIINNLVPYDETFIGSNYKSYKHSYYVACIDDKDSDILNNQFQKSEVSKIEWKTCNEALKSIRKYNIERKEILIKINLLLSSYVIID